MRARTVELGNAPDRNESGETCCYVTSNLWLAIICAMNHAH
jgi:hypothetical protein